MFNVPFCSIIEKIECSHIFTFPGKRRLCELNRNCQFWSWKNKKVLNELNCELFNYGMGKAGFKIHIVNPNF